MQLHVFMLAEKSTRKGLELNPNINVSWDWLTVIIIDPVAVEPSTGVIQGVILVVPAYTACTVSAGVAGRNTSSVGIKSMITPGSKVHGANMGPMWDRQDPGVSHIGLMILAIWDDMSNLKIFLDAPVPFSHNTLFRTKCVLLYNWCIVG